LQRLRFPAQAADRLPIPPMLTALAREAAKKIDSTLTRKQPKPNSSNRRCRWLAEHQQTHVRIWQSPERLQRHDLCRKLAPKVHIGGRELPIYSLPVDVGIQSSDPLRIPQLFRALPRCTPQRLVELRVLQHPADLRCERRWLKWFG
jgi:hypothetical protein